MSSKSKFPAYAGFDEHHDAYLRQLKMDDEGEYELNQIDELVSLAVATEQAASKEKVRGVGSRGTTKSIKLTAGVHLKVRLRDSCSHFFCTLRRYFQINSYL